MTCIESANPCNAAWRVLEPCVAKTCHVGVDHLEGWKHMYGTFLNEPGHEIESEAGACKTRRECMFCHPQHFLHSYAVLLILVTLVTVPNLYSLGYDWLVHILKCFASNIFQTLMVACMGCACHSLSDLDLNSRSQQQCGFLKMFARYCYRT